MTAAPLAIGCFRCGQAYEPDYTSWSRCADCGKTVGICLGCAEPPLNPRQFIDESMDWHRQKGCPTARQTDQIAAQMCAQTPEQQAKDLAAAARARVARVLNTGATFGWRPR